MKKLEVNVKETRKKLVKLVTNHPAICKDAGLVPEEIEKIDEQGILKVAFKLSQGLKTGIETIVFLKGNF